MNPEPKSKGQQSSVARTIRPIPKKWLICIGLGLFTLILVVIQGTPIATWLATHINEPIEKLVSTMENDYQKWFDTQDTTNPLLLMGLAFLGGLLASISPCILGMLPINLSYIGTLKIKSRWDALQQAGLFVLGAVTILSLLGLVSSFASGLMVDYRGHINIAVGIVMAMMGLWLMGVIRIPLPQTNIALPKSIGSYGVGLTFALVSSPCASPVLFAVLTAAATSGSTALSILTMVSYAIGYTMLIFLASLFAGLAKQSRKLLEHGEVVIKLGSIALIITGIYYVFSGAKWFLGS
jgi:cytochrome c-type biogenesis protein